eukprot:scaffold77497_cov69-Phaeocystis_antarctica.AAC.2
MAPLSSALMVTAPKTCRPNGSSASQRIRPGSTARTGVGRACGRHGTACECSAHAVHMGRACCAFA